MRGNGVKAWKGGVDAESVLGVGFNKNSVTKRLREGEVDEPLRKSNSGISPELTDGK